MPGLGKPCKALVQHLHRGNGRMLLLNFTQGSRIGIGRSDWHAKASMVMTESSI